MVKHISQEIGNTAELEPYRIAGAGAADKAVDQMLRQCNKESEIQQFVKGTTVAALGACDQMTATGASAAQVEAWAEAFNSAINARTAGLNAFTAKVAKLMRLVGHKPRIVVKGVNS